VRSPTTEQVRETLRAVSWPGFDQDIVAAGFVKQIADLGEHGARARRDDLADHLLAQHVRLSRQVRQSSRQIGPQPASVW